MDSGICQPLLLEKRVAVAVADDDFVYSAHVWVQCADLTI